MRISTNPYFEGEKTVMKKSNFVALILGTIGGNCGVFLSRKLPEAVYTYGLPLPKSLGNGGGKHLRK